MVCVLNSPHLIFKTHSSKAKNVYSTAAVIWYWVSTLDQNRDCRAQCANEKSPPHSHQGFGDEICSPGILEFIVT